MGQIGANLGNKNVMDPNQADWGDLDASEKAARVFGGAGKGLLNGYANYQQQNAAMRQGGGAMPYVSTPQTPAIQFPSSNFTPGPGAGTGQMNSLPSSARLRNPYFYGYGEGA